MKAGRRAVAERLPAYPLCNSLSRGYKQYMHASEKLWADFSRRCAYPEMQAPILATHATLLYSPEGLEWYFCDLRTPEIIGSSP